MNKRAYNPDEFQKRKHAAIESGTCTTCFRRPAQKGMRSCLRCYGRKKLYQRGRPKTAAQQKRHKGIKRAWAKRRAAERAAAGLCTCCGVRKARSGLRTCFTCSNPGARRTPRWLLKARSILKIIRR